jgi:hypothetical protein
MGGKADYEPTPGYEHKMHFIGPTNAPVWVGRKGDVPKLLTQSFWEAYRAWQVLNLGLGAPEPNTWIADAVAVMEGQYRAHFSENRRILERLDMIIQLLGGRRKGRPK